jgi:hypothetical protein
MSQGVAVCLASAWIKSSLAEGERQTSTPNIAIVGIKFYCGMELELSGMVTGYEDRPDGHADIRQGCLSPPGRLNK